MNRIFQAALSGGLLLPTVCLAAASSSLPQQTDQLLRQQQQQIEQQRQSLQQRPDVFLPASEDTARLPAAQTATPSAACFAIRSVRLDGAPADWLGWLQTQPLLGGCAGLADLNRLVAALTNALVARGFVTSRVYLPEQNLRSGELRLVVVPGRIHAIRLKEGGSDAGLRTAFPTGPGEILNVRDLEQGLEQLGRLPGQQATMEMVPADAPGDSDVVVTRQGGRPLSGALTLDDSGQDATGRL
ncbi:POTRA domain-containing protein [Chromobacterium sphagni]|nr:POTRA domain-containing protein [Chromobacterium sphagni]OHX20053.1 hypothetical protein BI344_15270 [Chromobacterium sphagni]